MKEKENLPDEYPFEGEEGEGFTTGIDEGDMTTKANLIYAVMIFILSFILHNTHTYDFVGKVLTQLVEQIGLGQLRVLFKGNTLVGVHSALLILMIYLLDRYVFDIIMNKVYPPEI